MSRLLLPEVLYQEGRFVRGHAIETNDSGVVLGSDVPRRTDDHRQTERFQDKAMLPGFVNIHSHSFQRLIRGRAESRAVSGRDFWSWRGTMYHAAAKLTPDDAYDVARMAFLEMLYAGTTTVGEFHYLHNAPDGRPYKDGNALARQVIAAAESVGIRLVMLRSAYLRSGFEVATDPGQARFFESTAQYLENMETLLGDEAGKGDLLRFGVAPHSVRAVPLADLHRIIQWARERSLPVHMHVAEQRAENEACMREYGATPVALLSREGLLGPEFTAIHAIHLSEAEVQQLAASGATVGSCPTTERNLGDGIFAAGMAMRSGIRVALGSDSQAQIAPLEDARQLDYHLRLVEQERAVLDQIDGMPIARRLFECATVAGARSLQVPAGELIEGQYADYITVALDDLSLAGADEQALLAAIVFGAERTAIRDVAVGGRLIVRDGHHALEEEIVARYKALSARVWGGRG